MTIVTEVTGITLTDTDKKALEEAVAYYELWGFKLWVLPKISIKSNGVTDSDYDRLVEMGLCEKEHHILQEEIAKELAAGKKEEDFKANMEFTKAFLGDEWNQYRITQAGLDYWNSLDQVTWLMNFLDETV